MFEPCTQSWEMEFYHCGACVCLNKTGRGLEASKFVETERWYELSIVCCC